MSAEDFEVKETYGFNIWHYFTPSYVGFEDDAKGTIFFNYFKGFMPFIEKPSS